jgi:fibronectin-binding autotransporter adhesin
VGSNWVGGNVPNNVVGDINNGGTATISGNENFTVTELWVGNNDGGTAQYGNVIQTGGTLTASNWLDVGRFGSTGDYNLAGGVVSQINGGDQIQIFGNNSATAPNATMEIGAGATLNVGGVLSIGESNGTVGWGNAAVTVNGGAINSGQIYIGDDGQGDNVAGGGGTGTLTLNSGTITSNNWVVIGRAGYSTGTLNMNGGTFIYTGQYGNFEVGGYQSNNIATLNLNAGLLQTNNIRTEDNGGSQTINFNGGTLQTNDNDSGFIGGHGTFTALNVQNGGAVIDTNGYNIGISEGLSHGTGTNPTDGGLTKIGAGTLTLSASNTYNGPTTINAGTLVVTGSLASAITVKSGATLNILGSTTSNVTVNSGGTVGSYSATGAGGSVMGSLTFTGSTILVVNPSGSQFMTVGGAVDGSSGTVLVSPVITTAPTGVAEEVLYAKGGILGSVGTNFKPTIRGTLSEASDASGVGTDLILTSSGAANLVWQGTSATNPSYWDIQTTPNWLNTGTGQTDVFYNSDNVTFDDTGATTSIAIQGIAVFPGSVTFNNSTAKSYTFSGGAIAGGGSLSILGGGMVTLNQSNSYTGATNINNGTLAVGASGSLSASTPVNLGSGASNGVLRLGDSTGAISVTVAALNVVGTGTGNELLGGNSNTSTLAVSSSILVGTPTTPTAVLTIGAGANLYGNTGGNPSIGIGPAAGLTGTVNVLTGGTLTSDSADIWIGNGSGGVGTLDISGGTVVSNGWIAPGRSTSPVVH